MAITSEQVRAAVAEHGSGRKAAAALGIGETTVRRHMAGTEDRVVRDQTDPMRTEVRVNGDEATITGPVLGTIGDLIRENGLEPNEWVIVSTTLNKWEGPLSGGGVQEFRQCKVTLRRKPELIFPQPPAHVPNLTRVIGRKPQQTRPKLCLIEGDHQAPYHDPDLDSAVTQMVRDIQPDQHVFLGDLPDFPDISRHADHPAATAHAQECLDAAYHILRRRAEAAPNADRKMLEGNHGWRLKSELLARAERMYGLTPVGETSSALSLRRLLHLDALGVELVEHPLGWEHAEIEIVPGSLVVRHGWLTGHNTAGRSLLKRGRSLIVGHTHNREHVFQWDPSAGIERQAAVCGTMSKARGDTFPHFAVADAWLQGCMTATVWPDGGFVLDHARWDGQTLSWRDKRWTA